MQDILPYISSYFGVDPDGASKIVKRFEPVTLEKGQYLIKEQQQCNRLAFVQSGMLRFHVPIGRKDVTHWLSGPGEFATEIASFFFRQPARWNIQALETCSLLVISESDYRTLGEEVEGWEYLQKLFIGKCFVAVEDRVFRQLSMTAEERCVWLEENRPDLFQQVPLQYIASMLGMTPETMSRVRKQHLLRNK